MEIQKVNNTEFEKTGLKISNGMDMEGWLTLGKTLEDMQGAIQWWIGDWLNYGERKYGEAYAQALSESKYTYDALAKMKWVSGKVKLCNRLQNLSWTHHEAIASLPEKKQKHYLDFAQKEKLSVKALKNQINASKQCECTIADMTETTYIIYSCEHGKKIKQKVEEIA